MAKTFNTTSINFQGIRTPEFNTKLNLVSLMDIFTILVFFLLLNSGDANEIENAKFITLPNSTATAVPHLEANIVISEKEIFLNDISVVKLDDLDHKKKQIQPLMNALSEYKSKRKEISNYEKVNGLAVTIMGDQSVPYSLIERVMASCSLEDYRDISLAVNKVVSKSIFASPNSSAGQVSPSQDGGG